MERWVQVVNLKLWYQRGAQRKGSKKLAKAIEGRKVYCGAEGVSCLKRMPRVTILSFARVALKILRGRKALIPPSILFPNGGNLERRCNDCVFVLLFLKYFKTVFTMKGLDNILRSGSRMPTKTDGNLSLSCSKHPFQ